MYALKLGALIIIKYRPIVENQGICSIKRESIQFFFPFSDPEKRGFPPVKHKIKLVWPKYSKSLILKCQFENMKRNIIFTHLKRIFDSLMKSVSSTRYLTPYKV